MELAEDMCVYKLDFDKYPTYMPSSEDNGTNPMVARTKAVICPLCNHDEAFYFQAPNIGRCVVLKFVCCNTNCTNCWTE
ncbi:hypothetical protein KP509_35G067400 [Ceratopteris richardii]|uniref:Uncharacterized protein n=1 Tax=Ceratopteris richardii TaxID=49495 RepID=A0A8T2QIM7_CERRI|nr:hypothetical protein KP509_35G067400 [Ceratopteris richardii]